MRRFLALSAAAAVILAARAAKASPVIDVSGAIGGNAGVQGVVSGPGPASAYFNPALLIDADDSALVAFAVISEQIGVTLDGRRGGDVPLIVGGRDILGPSLSPIPNDTVPTQWLQNGCTGGTQPGNCPPPGFPARPRQQAGTSGKTRSYLTLGLAKNLAKDRFSIGLYAMFPLSSFTTASDFYPDEREALFSNSLHPELYGDRLTAISFVAGGAFKLTPTLSIGAGISLALANTAASKTYVRDSTNYDTLLLNNAVTTQVNVAPTLGVRYAPVPWFRIGSALHAPESFDIDTTVTGTLPSGTESGTTRRSVYDYVPWKIDFGVEADVLRTPRYLLSVTGSIDYGFWSAYEDRHGQSPSVYGNDLAWRDTMSLALGLRHVLGPARGFMDVFYIPSPVPQQIGASNYVDNDRVGAAIGGDIELKLAGARIRPGVQLFGHRLVRRYNAKDDSRIVDELPDGSVFGSTHDAVPGAQGLQTNNPGWPGFASEGWIWGGAITIGVPL